MVRLIHIEYPMYQCQNQTTNLVIHQLALLKNDEKFVEVYTAMKQKAFDPMMRSNNTTFLHEFCKHGAVSPAKMTVIMETPNKLKNPRKWVKISKMPYINDKDASEFFELIGQNVNAEAKAKEQAIAVFKKFHFLENRRCFVAIASKLRKIAPQHQLTPLGAALKKLPEGWYRDIAKYI